MVSFLIKVYCMLHVCLGVAAVVEIGHGDLLELGINLLMAILIYLIHKAEDYR